MTIKETAKKKIAEFENKYDRKLTQNQLYTFLGFTKQHVQYSYKKDRALQKYIRKIEGAKVENIAKWLISDLKKALK